jgi:hypothetical protein
VPPGIEQHAFGDLKLQAPRIEAAFPQRRQDRRDQIGARELDRRNIDRNRTRARPLCRLPAFGLKHPFSNRGNDTGFFRDRDEFERGDGAPGQTVPAQQRFESGDPVRGQIKLRLIDQREFPKRQRAAQVDFEVAATVHLLVHRRLEEAIVSVPVAFRAMQGKIRVLQDLRAIEGAAGE